VKLCHPSNGIIAAIPNMNVRSSVAYPINPRLMCDSVEDHMTGSLEMTQFGVMHVA
jgi:hypothetical protein